MMRMDSSARFTQGNRPNQKDSIQLIAHDKDKTIIENITGRKMVRMKLRIIKGRWIVFKTTKIDGVTISTTAKIRNAA